MASLILWLGCTPVEQPGQAPPPQETARVRRLLLVRVQPPRLAGAFRWEAETAGLVTALLEAGLADLPDVAPLVGELPANPGFDQRVAAGSQSWSTRVFLGRDPNALQIDVEVCGPNGRCIPLQAWGTAKAPAAAVSQLLVGLAQRLDRPVDDALLERWQAPLSADEYAVLILGRAAATWYGLRPRTPSEERGDPRRDPIARSVFIDPELHVGWWLRGRDALAHGELEAAAAAFGQARLRWPGRALYVADLAAAQVRAEKHGQALVTWGELGVEGRGDPRIAAAWARTALRAGSPAESVALLDGLDASQQDDPLVVALRVDLASRDGVGEEDLGLLEKWARVDLERPEPVRRQIDALLELGRADAAFQLLGELERRGRPLEAAALAVPLALDRGDWERAEREALRLGWTDAAMDIEARAALVADPRALPDGLLAATGREQVLLRAAIRLERGEPAAAQEDAGQVLAESPWCPEALLLLSRAQGAQGDAQAQRKTLDLLALADPDGLYGQEMQRQAALAFPEDAPPAPLPAGGF